MGGIYHLGYTSGWCIYRVVYNRVYLRVVYIPGGVYQAIPQGVHKGCIPRVWQGVPQGGVFPGCGRVYLRVCIGWCIPGCEREGDLCAEW